jgi:hypothetical protein
VFALATEYDEPSSLSHLCCPLSSTFSTTGIDIEGNGLALSNGGELVGEERGLFGVVGNATGS